MACLSPQGRAFNQQVANDLAQRESIILVAGRYEGMTSGFMNRCVDEEWSIGDYILSGE